MSKLQAKFSNNDVETLSREVCHDGFLRVERLRLRHKLFAGGWSEALERELQLKSPAVGILLYDPRREELLLVRQFRIGMFADESACWPLELVAGMVEEGEQLHEVAIREAHEEANITPSQLIHICDYYNSPGGSNEKISLYCGQIDATDAGGFFGLADEHEDIEVVVLRYDEALHALKTGQLNNAMTIIALQWLQLHRQELLSSWRPEQH